MRQIDEIIATHDARHALILCTDGGVLYFRNEAGDRQNILVELPTLQRDPERDRTWRVKRVGKWGEVVLLRARKPDVSGEMSMSAMGSERIYTSICVQVLSGDKITKLWSAFETTRRYQN